MDQQNTTFEEFKKLCLEELQFNKDAYINKIRKLPNILVRNDRDIKRLKNDQELEIFLN